MERDTDAAILERMNKVLYDVLKVKPENLKMDSRYVDDLGADSLDRISLLMALEEEFDAEIPDEEGDALTTVGETIDYIRNKLLKKS